MTKVDDRGGGGAADGAAGDGATSWGEQVARLKEVEMEELLEKREV